jgi:hypothetical protein
VGPLGGDAILPRQIESAKRIVLQMVGQRQARQRFAAGNYRGGGAFPVTFGARGSGLISRLVPFALMLFSAGADPLPLLTPLPVALGVRPAPGLVFVLNPVPKPVPALLAMPDCAPFVPLPAGFTGCA